MSAVFVPGPQAFVAAASDTGTLAKNFNSTPGAAQCSTNTQTTLASVWRPPQACPTFPRSTSQPQTPVCGVPRQRPLNGFSEAIPNSDRLAPCSSRENLLRPAPSPTCFNRAEDSNSPTSSGGEGEYILLSRDILRTVARNAMEPVEVVRRCDGSQIPLPSRRLPSHVDAT